ncbi:cobalamin-5-phosphate synthase [Sulfurimonas gotlandica GD1]|uniref:Adenosylcobinamide-GDP ribazoletransferase n=1 Tax=Sulfurimonas gotlandica (strain DSM 19862 / JCM 16533 / GD1) TaxID=929558 RepID=B6BH77_SULGG|nr:adenosylcobinamide-GDP ribazoletransferase [Sulfurimonas gotlandica]EDZ63141.1 cobalamin 5'-phosphate synthase [Sulfurimonas gotlandica GD1]EHP29866.1 cobalamin-5-phosphate synthase [Sulfurimonas gotlandica GD1]
MKNFFKGFALAVSMLTSIPFFKVHDFNKGINGYAVLFYPLVGFLLGLILWTTHSLLEVHITDLHLGIIIFTLWVILTGALHLDGLSDTIDGLFVSKERALEVMKDPNTGGMGMIFTVTFLILKASSLAVFDAFYLLPVVLLLSRFNAVLAIYFFPYISQNGMGTLAKEELKGKQVLIAFIYVTLLSISTLGLFVLSLLVLSLIKTFFIRRYGGFSGDIYGFTIEITELILLNAILLGLAL